MVVQSKFIYILHSLESKWPLESNHSLRPLISKMSRAIFQDSMLCGVMLCGVMLCGVMLCGVMLCGVMSSGTFLLNIIILVYMFLRPEISILNSSCPFSTVSPSATRSSEITPAAGELTGKAVCKQQHNYVNGVSWYHRLDIDPLHI